MQYVDQTELPMQQKYNEYCKRQELSERKVLRFTGFYLNVGKIYVIAFIILLIKVPLLLKVLVMKTFTIHQKFAKTARLFSFVAFVAHSIL